MGIVKRRFEQWRRTRAGRGRIPETLWAMAVAAAKEHGSYKTARTLRLNYTALNKRVAVGGSRGSWPDKEAPRFVQLPMAPAGGSPECIVEVENGEGTKLRIHLKGGATADLASLSRAVLGAER